MDEEESRIIYTIIAKGDKPLVEFSNFTGTFRQDCIEFLPKVERNASKAIQKDETIIYYFNDNQTNITILMMAGKKYPKATAVGYLKDIQSLFFNKFPKDDYDFDGISKFGLNNEFKDTLREKMNYYNENKEISSSSLNELSVEINKMKDEVIKSSDLLNERGEKVKALDEKSEHLVESSGNYYRESVKVRKKECWNKYKLYIGIGVAVLVIIGIICLIVFTGDDN